MSALAFDLKLAIAQVNSLIADILATSQTLVLEVEAPHYWTTFSLSTFAQIKGITENLLKLIELTRPQWEGDAAGLFDEPAGIKLWMTAAGLWQALPAVRAKFTEQLSLRRRQRIMGREIEEAEEIDPEVFAEELAAFRKEHSVLRDALGLLGDASESLPDGLAPTPEQLEKAKHEATRRQALDNVQLEPDAAPLARDVDTAAAASQLPEDGTQSADDGAAPQAHVQPSSQAESSTPPAGDGDSAAADPDDTPPV